MQWLTEYDASDIDAGLSPDGSGTLTLLTAEGRVVVHARRAVLESLAVRIKEELSRVAPPARKR